MNRSRSFQMGEANQHQPILRFAKRQIFHLPHSLLQLASGAYRGQTLVQILQRLYHLIAAFFQTLKSAVSTISGLAERAISRATAMASPSSKWLQSS